MSDIEIRFQADLATLEEMRAQIERTPSLPMLLDRRCVGRLHSARIVSGALIAILSTDNAAVLDRLSSPGIQGISVRVADSPSIDSQLTALGDAFKDLAKALPPDVFSTRKDREYWKPKHFEPKRRVARRR